MSRRENWRRFKRHASAWAALCLWCVPQAGLAEQPPAKAIDLTHWKLTLPYAAPGSKKPLEIKQPKLATFADARHFFVNGDGHVVFRAYCTSISTKKSSYPRTELREMSGQEKASWGTADGKLHRMTAKLAITALPPVKPHVVCAQIHDAGDDLLMIRLERKKLFVERNKVGDVPLDNDYKPGTPFKIRIEADRGVVKVWYNDALKMDWAVKRNGCYFKAGCYTQSNPHKGDKPESYGEVVYRSLKVEHGSP